MTDDNGFRQIARQGCIRVDNKRLHGGLDLLPVTKIDFISHFGIARVDKIKLGPADHKLQRFAGQVFLGHR
ncbi:hypothetical protein D3C80_1606650 [compost metagenome]